jgi:hypothetical protein
MHVQSRLFPGKKEKPIIAVPENCRTHHDILLVLVQNGNLESPNLDGALGHGDFPPLRH